MTHHFENLVDVRKKGEGVESSNVQDVAEEQKRPTVALSEAAVATHNLVERVHSVHVFVVIQNKSWLAVLFLVHFIIVMGRITAQFFFGT